ncbi:hypothetical protein ABZ714_33885 [Streptomyces sp. NPDC006798]|uniref:hypothetical protein n=1 Tax=Streptomyces sp. NPDC006798 TaxID=3155462 RepID=UPI0033DCEFFC
MSDARPPLRALRAAIFAAVCTALSATGHIWMSGHELPSAVLLPAFVVAAVTGWLAGGRRRGPFSIGTGLLAGQAAMHLLYSGAQGHAAPAGHRGPRPEPLAALEHGTPVTRPGGSARFLPDAADVLSGTGAGMIAVHLLAAAVCGLWLSRGEAAFLQLARALAALAFVPLKALFAAVRTPEAPGRAAAPRTTAAERPGGIVVLGHTLIRRGPPDPFRIRAAAPGAAV